MENSTPSPFSTRFMATVKPPSLCLSTEFGSKSIIVPIYKKGMQTRQAITEGCLYLA